MYQTTTTAHISQRHAVVIHQRFFSLRVLYLQILSVFHGTFCAHCLAEMTRGGTSCFSVSDGSNWIISVSLNANFSQTGFCIVCSFQVDCNLSIFFLNSYLKFLNPDSVKKMESWHVLKIQLQLLFLFFLFSNFFLEVIAFQICLSDDLFSNSSSLYLKCHVWLSGCYVKPNMF